MIDMDVCHFYGAVKLHEVEDVSACPFYDESPLEGRPHYYRAEWQPTTHRVRRGRLVEIPIEWRGRTSRAQMIRKRQSKLPRKIRRFVGKQNRNGDRGDGSRTHDRRAAIAESQDGGER